MPIEGREEYQKARKLGLREYRKALVTGKSPYPAVLDDIVKRSDILAEVSVGIAEIPLEMIAGTKTAGRTTAFANNFMPILKENTEFAWKWSSLYEAQQEEGIHDPIKAYEYMNRFYVMEGNKRVSVSRYCDLTSISADITRVLPVKSEQKEVKLYYEFLDFYKVAPLYTIQFSREGFYQKFAEVMGLDLIHPWPDSVLETIKASFAVFEKIYKEKGGNKMGATSADTYLIYLTFYSVDSLLDDKEELIASRIDRLWNEFLAETGDEVKLVESPEDIVKPGNGLFDIFRTGPRYSLDKPLRVAFIYDKNPDISGWIYGHELGRNHLVSYFDGLVDAVRFDNCATDTAIRKAIDAAVADEDEIIFTTSPAMMPETVRSAIHYPKNSFLNCSINLSSNAVRTYYCKMYEAKFILGALAASYAEDHRIGYVADYPIYGGIANINAFAIGAAMVDPHAKIYLQWSSKKDTDWKKYFKEEGIHLISGPDIIRPDSPTREYGLYLEENGKITNLAVPVWNWGKYYEKIIRGVLEGNWEARTQDSKGQALNYWWGMESEVIDVILSDHIPYASAKLVQTIREGILGQTARPFDGEIHAQSGIVHKADEPAMTNEQIITMNWLCDNVIGDIPDMNELIESAKDTVKMAGVDD